MSVNPAPTVAPKQRADKGLREVRRRVGVFAGPRLKQTLKGQQGFAAFAHGRHSANHTHIINHLATLYGYRTYLEIGVRIRENNLDKILVPETTGVDPNPATRADFVMTSDAFFEQEGHRRFDLIFIDGLHTGEQVARDIENSLNALNPGGTIVLHDLNPPTAEIGRPDPSVKASVASWCGTSWQGFVQYRATRDDLEMYVVDADWGCGIIRRGRQTPYKGPWRTYEDLDANRKEALNLITVQEFLRRHPAPLSRKLSVALRGR